jgi:hypothetical protein
MTNYSQPPYNAPTPPPGGPYSMTPGAPGAPGTPPERRQYPLFAPLFLWFSKSLWYDVGQRWRGICFFYLLLVLAATTAATFARAYADYAPFVRDEVPKFTDQLPPITISKGVATVDVEQPHTISDPETGEPMIVIDTTGETTTPPEPGPSMLLTRDSLIVNDEDGIETHDLSDFNNLRDPISLDGRTVHGWFAWVQRNFFTVLYPSAVALQLLARIIQMLIYGGLAMAVASGSNVRLTYAGGMRLAAVAVTPILLIDTALVLLGLDLGGWWTLAGIGLAITLLVLAVRANPPTVPGYSGSYPGSYPGGGGGYPGYAGYAPQPAGYPAAPGYPGYPPAQSPALPGTPPQQQQYPPPPAQWPPPGGPR